MCSWCSSWASTNGRCPGRIVKRETYLKEYHDLTHKDGVPFIPDAFRKDFVFSGIIILALVLCAAFFGPFGPKGQPDPTIVQTVPRPDYFFLWGFAGLALLPANLETFLFDCGTGYWHRFLDCVAASSLALVKRAGVAGPSQF